MASSHKFWSTQPVNRSNDCDSAKNNSVIESTPIISFPPADTIDKNSFSLPEEFEWTTIDMEDRKLIEEVYTLLCQNYVEDVESMFRFDYPTKFLKWAMNPPNYSVNGTIGVRVKGGSGKLVAFISAIPMNLVLHGRTIKSPTKGCVEVNFLCVHKKLRSKRLTPLLIKEITRRMMLEGHHQALFTTGIIIPGLISKAKYYHRPINMRRLIESNFAPLPQHLTIEDVESMFPVREVTPANFRPIRMEDCESVFPLLNTSLSQYKLHCQFSLEEIRHWFVDADIDELSSKKTVYGYVTEDSQGNITNFISFYSLPSTITSKKKKEGLNVAYLFYYATTDDTVLSSLIEAILYRAKLEGFDVFNCVEVMRNSSFLDELLFREGDGDLNYYLYNWECPTLSPRDVGVVML